MQRRSNANELLGQDTDLSRDFIASIEGEYRRYEMLGTAATAQCPDEYLCAAAGDGNSLATLIWHVSGNLKSRFTDFMASDGEKEWRNRDDEFAARQVEHSEAEAKWAEGWSVLWDALSGLTDNDLTRQITIRGQGLVVHEALHRSLAHTASHVGQMQYIAKAYAGDAWASLSIPPGQSAAYNMNPTREKIPPK
jgi:hypothetical protein